METEEGLSDDDLEIANKILISDGLALNLEKLTSDALLIEQLNSKFSVSELKTQFARMKCVLKSNLLPELIFPDNWLAVGLRGCVSISELEHNDWIRKWLDDTAPGEAMGLLNKIERLVPESIQLGSRRVNINYELDQNPWVESRIQDFFGMKEGPSILNGRLLLTLHLLAPNQRAVQVTQSLSGFWQNHYPKIRQELGRRYPKHKWPMDPVKGV
jgi:HrpA-like RNA helicase